MKPAEVAEAAKKLLDPKKLPLPEKPKVVDIRVRPYVDHTGEDALEVWIILAEGTTSADWNVDNIRAIRRAISDALLSAGIEEFPYTRFGTRSEIEEAGIEV
jgi:hypothetical protein